MTSFKTSVPSVTWYIFLGLYFPLVRNVNASILIDLLSIPHTGGDVYLKKNQMYIRMHDVGPRRDHYRLLRRTHHRTLLRAIGYRRERGTYRQLSYAQALKKTGCQSVRLLFEGAMARQPAGRLPKRLIDGKLVGGEDPGKGRPEQNWMDCLKDDFQAFGAIDGSTVDNRLTFGVDRAVWTLAAKMDDGAPWHKGVLQGAEKFMTSWHKEEEEASR